MPAALRIDPDLNEVGALAGDLVDLGPRLVRCLVFRSWRHRRRHEAVLHRHDARAAQVAGLLRCLESRDVVRVERHAGRRGDAVAGVLPQLRVTVCAHMPVRIDDARHHEFSGRVDDVGPGRDGYGGRRAHLLDAAVRHHDRRVAQHGAAAAVDHGRMRQDVDLGGGATGKEHGRDQRGQRVCPHRFLPALARTGAVRHRAVRLPALPASVHIEGRNRCRVVRAGEQPRISRRRRSARGARVPVRAVQHIARSEQGGR